MDQAPGSSGARTGSTIRATSRYGTAELPARILNTVRSGEAFATFASPEVFLNRLTGPGRDAITSTPQYKLTAIRIDKVQSQV